MRVSAHSVLLSEEQRDRFFALLSEHGVRSEPKQVMGEHDFPFVQFQLPIKWKEHQIQDFLKDLESLAQFGRN